MLYPNKTISGESRAANGATLDYSGLLISKKNFVEIFGMNLVPNLQNLVDYSLSDFLVGYFSIDSANFSIERSIETEKDLFNINNLEYYKNKYILKIIEDGIFHLKKLYIEKKICILDIDENMCMIIFATENTNGFCKYDPENTGDTHFYIDILQASGILRLKNS